MAAVVAVTEVVTGPPPEDGPLPEATYTTTPPPAPTTERPTTEDTDMPDSLPLPADLPEPHTGEIIMTRRQLGRSRRPWLNDAKYRIYSRDVGGYSRGWWGPNMAGFFPTREQAGVTTMALVMAALGGEEDGAVFIYIEDPSYKAPPVDPAKPQRRCRMESTVGSVVFNLIKAAPKNETFRAKVMAAVGEMPPKDADTFEKIKDWVEFNFPKTKSEATSGPVFDVSVSFNDISEGRCRYRRSQQGHSRVKLTAEDIKGIVDNIDGECDFDDFISEVANLIESRATDGCTNYTDEAISTTDLSEEDSVTEDFNYSMSLVKSSVRVHLMNFYPELAQEMGVE